MHLSYSFTHCWAWPAEGRNDLHIDRSTAVIRSELTGSPRSFFHLLESHSTWSARWASPVGCRKDATKRQLRAACLMRRRFRWTSTECGRTRSDDGQLLWVADHWDQSSHWLQYSWHGPTTILQFATVTSYEKLEFSHCLTFLTAQVSD